MTIPVERTRAVLQTRSFLFDLLDPKQTPRVPREIRQRAARMLRHYPWWLDLDDAAKGAPQKFARPGEI